MTYIKHILKYSAFVLIATIFSLFASLSWIENIGLIFAFPSAKIVPLFSWAYGVCVAPLYAIIFYQSAAKRPKQVFLTGLLVLLLSMGILFVTLETSYLDFAFAAAIYLLATSAAFLIKKRQRKKTLDAEAATNENQTFYFPLSTFKLCVMYFLTFGLFKYYWWYKNWQYINHRDNKNYSSLFRSIFAVFFYESFLDDINKINQSHGVHGIKYPSLLTSYYILLVIGTIFISVISAVYNTFGLQLHYSPSSLVSIFSIIIYTLAILLYVAPQLAINRLNRAYGNKQAPYIKIPVVIFIYILIGVTIWLPACAKWVSAFRNDTQNAFILYDYGHYQAAYKKAINHAYDEDDADAKLLVGQMYLYGKGVPQDMAQALGWLEDAASHGNIEAQYLTGLLYRSGINDNPPDYKKSAMWYQKAVAGGNAYAANDLATLYSSGLGVEKNHDKAFALYQLAAAKGDGYAMYNIGLHYEREISPPNYKLAAEWYEKSIKTKPNACAYHDLGMLYATGAGVPRDTEKSNDLLENAARELLIDYQAEIIELAAITKRLDTDSLVTIFAAYSQNQATKKNSAESEKKYPPDELKAVKIMSEKIKVICWD